MCCYEECSHMIRAPFPNFNYCPINFNIAARRLIRPLIWVQHHHTMSKVETIIFLGFSYEYGSPSLKRPILYNSPWKIISKFKNNISLVSLTQFLHLSQFLKYSCTQLKDFKINIIFIYTFIPIVSGISNYSYNLDFCVV